MTDNFSSRAFGTCRSSSGPALGVSRPCALCSRHFILADDLYLVDKMEQMLGSYGPHPKGEAYVKNFDPEESPSGMMARSGTYHVRSRVVDDDGEVYAGAFAPSRSMALH